MSGVEKCARRAVAPATRPWSQRLPDRRGLRVIDPTAATCASAAPRRGSGSVLGYWPCGQPSHSRSGMRRPAHAQGNALHAPSSVRPPSVSGCTVRNIGAPCPPEGPPSRACAPSAEDNAPNVPVYVYRRQDGSTFEVEQRMTEDSLLHCPTTGQTVERVLQPFTPRYTGTGFYSTDHRKPKGTQRPKGAGDGDP